MPGPRNKSNSKANAKPKASKQPTPIEKQPLPTETQPLPTGDPALTKPSASEKASAAALCLTLEEDEVTRCNKPATAGHPQRNRCRNHHAQYVKLYKKYKEASQVVDNIKQGGVIPTREQMAQYSDIKISLEKARFMRKYLEAIRVEKTGRDIHGRRFFGKSEQILKKIR